MSLLDLFEFKLDPPKDDDLITEDSEDPFSQAEYGDPTRFQRLCYLLLGVSYIILWVDLPKGGASRRSRVRAWGLFYRWMLPAYKYVAPWSLSWAAPAQLYTTARWTPYGRPREWVWFDWVLAGVYTGLTLIFTWAGYYLLALIAVASIYLALGVLPRALSLLDRWIMKRLIP